MAIAMALLVCTAVVLYGSVTVRMAAPLYGLAFLLAFLWATKLFFVEKVTWKHSPMHWPVLGFMAYAMVRYFSSPIEYESRHELFKVGLCTLLYFLCASNFSHSRDRSIFLGTLVVLAAGESAYAIWQLCTKATTVLVLERPAQYFQRGSGTYFCPNHLAGFLEMALGLLLARIAVFRPVKTSVQQSALQKIVYVYAAILMVGGLLATLSRGGWIALLIGLAMLLLFGGWDWHVVWPRVLSVGLVIGLLVFLAFRVDAVRNRIVRTLGENKGDKGLSVADPSLGGRTQIWRATAAMIRNHPVLGSGAATWQWFYPKYRPEGLPSNPEYPHNDILNLLSDYGVIGFAFILVALWCYFRQVFLLAGPGHSSEQRSFAIGSAIAVTAILVHSWFDFNLHILANAVLFMAILGFTVAMDDQHGRYARTEMKPWARYSLAIVLLLGTGFGAWRFSTSALAYHYTVLGNGAKSILRWNDALDFYARAQRLDPKYPQLYAKIGDVYRQKSEWRRDPSHEKERLELARKSITYYNDSLALNPFQSEVILRLARAYELVVDNNSALKSYLRAIEVDPLNPLNFQYLGRFYRDIGDEKKAVDAFNRASVLNWGYNDVIAPINLEELRPK